MFLFAPDGADFIGVSGSSERLIFGPGESSQVILIQIADDPLFEEEVENFTVTLSTDVPGLQLSNSIATVSIRDTDSEFKAAVVDRLCIILLSVIITNISNYYWISHNRVYCD